MEMKVPSIFVSRCGTSIPHATSNFAPFPPHTLSVVCCPPVAPVRLSLFVNRSRNRLFGAPGPPQVPRPSATLCERPASSSFPAASFGSTIAHAPFRVTTIDRVYLPVVPSFAVIVANSATARLVDMEQQQKITRAAGAQLSAVAPTATLSPATMRTRSALMATSTAATAPVLPVDIFDDTDVVMTHDASACAPTGASCNDDVRPRVMQNSNVCVHSVM